MYVPSMVLWPFLFGTCSGRGQSDNRHWIDVGWWMEAKQSTTCPPNSPAACWNSLTLYRALPEPLCTSQAHFHLIVPTPSPALELQHEPQPEPEPRPMITPALHRLAFTEHFTAYVKCAGRCHVKSDGWPRAPRLVPPAPPPTSTPGPPPAPPGSRLRSSRQPLSIAPGVSNVQPSTYGVAPVAWMNQPLLHTCI